jgi:hypothetical protein
MFFFTEDLVTSIKLRSFAPVSDKTFVDPDDFIRLANEVMMASLVPDILGVREDFFLRSRSVTIQSGLNHYPVSERAIGNSLKDVWYYPSSGNPRALPRLDIRDETFFGQGASDPIGYYFKGDEIVLVPTPVSSGSSLKVWYFSRPSQLVPTTSCSKILSVVSGGGTTTFTVDTDLSATVSVGSTLDLLNAQSPFILWVEDAVVTAITNSTIAFTTTSVSDEAGNVGPQAGDYICPSQKANIPMVPQEFHPTLSQMVVVRLMESLGDLQKYQASQATLAEMRRQAIHLISNRSELGTKAIVSRTGIFSYISGSSWFSNRPR